MRVGVALIVGLAALALAASAQAATWTVTNGSSDATTACDEVAFTCVSLRAAITAANRSTGADVINVPAGTINVNNDLVISSEITINGVSARSNIVDGNAKYRGFRVATGAVATINHFTVRDGAASQGGSSDGGGILNQGQTVLSDVRVTGSQAANGGGIANLQGGLLALQRVLVDANTASADGGGIANIGGNETTPITYVAMTDSTVFDNTAGIGGTGGIASRRAGSLLVVQRSTIADNESGLRGIGGLTVLTSARALVSGTVIARNLLAGEPSNCGSVAPTDSGSNVEDDGTCGFSLTANPQLDTKLTSAGGDVDVLTIGSGSPAVDRVAVGDLCPSATLDQRRLHRPQGSACDAGAFEVDQAATMTITSGPSGTVDSGDVQFTFSASEPGVEPLCRLTGPGQSGTYVACYKVNAQPYSGLANGSYTFSVRDGAFAGSTPASRSFTVAALDTTITGGPSGPTNDTTPTFTFTGVSAAGFECRVDSAAFASCTSPHTTASLSQGAHTFEVRALNAAGAPDPTPASRSFTVDTVAPNTTITGGPSGSVSSTTATFTFSSSETGSTFECALDGSAFGTCPSSYTGLSQGSHTFQVRARDAAGNVDASPASRTWTVDTVDPDTTITSGPSGPTNDSTPTFAFTASEAGAAFACSIDGGAFASCTTPHTTGTLSDGSHTFRVRATDAAGNVDPSPASRTFTVDTAAPNTSLTPIPSPNNDATPTFEFTSEAGATFQCRVDGGTYATCTSPHTTGTLADGQHTFDVRARDAAGNVDATPASQTFVIDTSTPNTTLTPIASPTNDTTPTFTFTGENGAVGFQCRVDGGAYAACASPHTTGALAEGSHTFEVRAVSSTGTSDPTPASQTFVVDLTPPPAPTVVSGPDGPTADPSPTFVFSAAEAETVTCRLDGPEGQAGTFAACTSPQSFSGLAPGAYVFSVRSADAAGNTRTTERAFTVTVAQGGPSPTPTPTVAPAQTPAPTPTPTPTAVPTPVAGQSVVAEPVAGTVLVKLPGSSRFVPLSPSLIRNGSEVDAREGTVELTRADGGKAKFYGGIFKLSQSGGITTLTLTQKLTGCPTAKRKARAAATKKPKSRKLWGDGKGKFRTKGRYSSATVRGTKWLVQDTCTTTLTRVTSGAVTVEDFAKKKKVVLRKGKRYTARPKKR